MPEARTGVANCCSGGLIAVLERWQSRVFSPPHRRLPEGPQECGRLFDAAAAAPDGGASAEQLAALRSRFADFRQLCEAHYLEEERVGGWEGECVSAGSFRRRSAVHWCRWRQLCQAGCLDEEQVDACRLFAWTKPTCRAARPAPPQETLPLIRRHFAPEEVRPTAKQISKAYGLLDMGGWVGAGGCLVRDRWAGGQAVWGVARWWLIGCRRRRQARGDPCLGPAAQLPALPACQHPCPHTTPPHHAPVPAPQATTCAP